MIRLPTRVIGVSSDPPRLIVTRDEGITYGRYAALSYCWGGPQPIRTTRETLSDHIRSIPFKSLPRTLQDAITVTRKLGLKYIWIDALCIIQDDEADRQRELPSMGKIYNSAYVTISASTAVSCHDGFLEPRQLEHKPIRLRAKSLNAKMGSVLLMRDFSEVFQDSVPIHKRGWTLQEHLLAPRLLVFGLLRTQYICTAGIQYDGGSPIPLGAPRFGLPKLGYSTLFAAEYGGFMTEGSKRRIQSLPYRTHLMDLAVRMTGEVGKITQMLIEHWCDIVTAYTSRHLGVPDDRLDAIAGIAGKVHRRELGQYLAGIFSTYLHSQLLWRRAGNQLLLPRPTGRYRCPSWSWASVDGAVSLKVDPFQLSDIGASIQTPHVLRCQVAPISDTDKYSRFSSGMLQVLGKTKSMIIPVDPQTGNLAIPQACEGLSIIQDAISPWEHQFADVCFLIILDRRRYVQGINIEGLLLLKMEQAKYQRIGYFSGECESLEDNIIGWVEKEVTII